MALANEAGINWQRFNSGDTGVIGSYINFRTLAIRQLTSEATLPKDGIWFLVDSSGSQTFANIATTINTALGTSYTSSSFHAHTSSDLAYEPGKSVNDE